MLNSLSSSANPFQAASLAAAPNMRPVAPAFGQPAPLHAVNTSWGSAPASAYQSLHPGLLFGAKRKSAIADAKEPMLATEVDMSKVKYPVYMSPKVDGNRGMVQDGKILGRGKVEIPNPFVREILGRPELEGFDGELICGKPNEAEVLSRTNSLLRPTTRTEGDLKFMVFDLMNEGDKPLSERLATLKERYAKLPASIKKYVKLMPQKLVQTEAQVLKQEAAWLKEGYEGAILRNPDAPYKNKRSSMTDQGLMKLKRFKDAEAVLVDCYPLTVGCTAAKSIIKSGLLTADQIKNLKDSEQAAAGYILEDLTTQTQFRMGTPPMTLEERRTLWKGRGGLKGKIVKYKYFPYSDSKVPRHATMIGFREDFDMPADLKSIAKKITKLKVKVNDDAA